MVLKGMFSEITLRLVYTAKAKVDLIAFYVIH